MAAQYVGRFAPSPSGPLHFGSLATALASFLDARQNHGRWLLRIEDIDPPREVSGATEEIISGLVCHGLQWDGEITRQSERSDLYDRALDALDRNGHLYACTCTRKQLRAAEQAGRTTPGCPQDCRSMNLPHEDNPLRVAVPSGPVTANDILLGEQVAHVEKEPGDFLVRRRDGLYAYQLAVVVDDYDQHVTHVVRGADLLDNSPRQVALAGLLGYPAPRYLHLPLALDDTGRKLSKQTGAHPIANNSALDNLLSAWTFLGQITLPARPDNIAEFLQFAVSRWSRQLLPCANDAICC